jgi:hypothetical protein
MIGAESRYQDAVKTFATSHIYDEYGRLLLDGEEAGYPIPRTATHETTYRLQTPASTTTGPVIEYYIKDGESMQYLAWKLLRSHSAWWQIAEVNQHVWYPLDTPLGTKIRIPT